MGGKPREIPCDDLTAAELVADLLAIEAEIAEQQDAKGAIYKAARETYGKRFANGLKLAIKIERMDAAKLDEVEEVDAEADRILAAFRKPRAPRATRAREIIEQFPVEHDADGVFPDDEPQSGTAVQMHRSDEAAELPASEEGQTSLAGVEGIADQHPITEQQSAPQAASDLTVPQTSGQVATNTLKTADDDGEAQKVERRSPKPEDAGSIPATLANAGSSNGRTAEFDSADAGSTPAPASKPLYAEPGEVVMESCPPVGIVAHPYATCWPVNTVDVSGGVREPIVKSAQFILDGRGRYFAARRDGIEYPVVQYDGDDELADSIAWNLASRPGMSATALRIVAEKLAKLVPDRAEEIMERFGLGEAQEAAQ